MSWGLLLEDLSALYNAGRPHAPPPPAPPPELSFADWTTRQLEGYTRPSTLAALTAVVEEVIRGGENRGTTVRAPLSMQQLWTVTYHNGPDRLGLWCNAAP